MTAPNEDDGRFAGFDFDPGNVPGSLQAVQAATAYLVKSGTIPDGPTAQAAAVAAVYGITAFGIPIGDPPPRKRKDTTT